MQIPAWSVVASASLTWMGCRSPTVDAHTSPSAAAPASASAIASSSATQAASSTPPKLAHAFDDGCAGDIDRSLSSDKQLEAMRRACAPGFAAPGSWKEPVHLVADLSRRMEIDLPAHACIRIGISTKTEGAAVRVALRDGSGVVLLDPVSGHPPMLAPSKGPVCVGAGGKHGVEVTSLGADADVRLALWIAQPPPPASSK